MAQLPIKFVENIQLQKVGINQACINFSSLTLESDKYICICDKSTDNRQVYIVDVANPNQMSSYPMKADSARMNATKNYIALKSAKNIQVSDTDRKFKIKSYQLTEDVVYWKWISVNVIVMVTETSVYHWNIDDASDAPVKMFDRHESLVGSQIISYRVDPTLQWLALVGISVKESRIVGAIQLYSVPRKVSQPVEGHACVFTEVLLEGNTTPSSVFAFSVRSANAAKLNIIELGQPTVGNNPFPKRSVDVFYPPDAASDFPIAMHSDKHSGIVYIVTKMGYIHMYELESGSCLFVNKISQEVIFVSADLIKGDGFICVNRTGSVLSISTNSQQIVSYLISKQLEDVAYKLAARAGYPGAEDVFVTKFNDLFNRGMYADASKIAAKSTGTSIRNSQTIARFQALQPPGPGQPAPILTYFSTLLEKTKLNSLETIEICKPVFQQGKKSLVEKWLVEDKLECTEELGDMAKNIDINLALSIYLRCNCHAKVVQCFGETGDFRKISIYAKKVNYQPDYPRILRSILYTNPDAGIQFAKSLIKEEVEIDINSMANVFMEMRLTAHYASFLLEALKKDLPEQGDLQTKLLEMTVMTQPQVAEAIFSNNILSHFDKPHIAKLCEQNGLLQRALQFYTDIYEIKRAIVQTHLLNPDWLVNFFGSLSVEDSLICLNAMLEYNLRQNLQVAVQIAVKYHEQLGCNSLIRLFENYKSAEGLFLFLSPIVNFSQDPEVHFKYIQAACKTGQIKEVERICKESNIYDPEKVKNYLKEVKLPDQIALIIVCDRFDFVEDLVLHLYKNNLLKFIEIYVVKFNPSRLPKIVGALLDVDCAEDFIRSMMIACPPNYDMAELVSEVSKRNRIKLIRPLIESRIASGSTDPGVHSALAIVYIDSNNRPDVFLADNAYYDCMLVGKYCEARDPTLACIAFEKGAHDDEFIRVCTNNSLYKNLSRYAISKKNPDLWAKLLDPSNDFRRAFIDQVVQSVLADTYDSACISVMVKSFMVADLPSDLIDLLEKIVLGDSPHKSYRNLQNLLLLASIKSDPSRLIDYLNRLDNYDAPNIAEVALQNQLYEEAFAIYKKYNVHASAVQVLVDHMKNLDRAYEYTERCNFPAAWSVLGKAQLENDQYKEALDSFIKAQDPSFYTQVIASSSRFNFYEQTLKYLMMVRSTTRDGLIDSEIAYCMARVGRSEKLNEFLEQPQNVNVLAVGDRLFEEEQYESAKIFYNYAHNFPKLAATHVKLKEFQMAVEMASKANKPYNWKIVCQACLENKEYRYAQMCALKLVIRPEELEELIQLYENLGLYNELITLIETSLNLERAHMGIFTELSILYAKYRPNKVRDHLELFWTRINIPKVIKAAETYNLWSELVFLYDKYEDNDNAITTMIAHPSSAFIDPLFRDIIQRSANQELYHKSIKFYFEYKPTMINELMIVLSQRIDHHKAISQLKTLGVLPMCKQYLIHAQKLNMAIINESLNEILIEEESYEELRNSIANFNNFDALRLAQTLEKHSSLEFRRISNTIYKSCNRWNQSIELAKKNGLNSDAIIYAAESKDPEAAQSLLDHFISLDRPDFVVSLLYFCFDILKPDNVMEACWLGNMKDYTMPYMIQIMHDYHNQKDSQISTKKETHEENATPLSVYQTPQLMLTGPSYSLHSMQNTSFSPRVQSQYGSHQALATRNPFS